MHNITKISKTLYCRFRSFLRYGMISVFVTIIDVLVSRVSEITFDPVVANTIGVIVGFIIQYFLTAQHVYNNKDLRTFIVFLLTFFIGLILANVIVFFSRNFLFVDMETNLAFLISKGFSIVVPFFITYFIRKKFIVTICDER